LFNSQTYLLCFGIYSLLCIVFVVKPSSQEPMFQVLGSRSAATEFPLHIKAFLIEMGQQIPHSPEACKF